MTNMTLQAVRQLIANDCYAITFQSVEQYRGTLLRHFDSLVEAPRPSWGRVHTVGDMVRNLLTLDQSEPIFSAFHIDFDGARRYRTSPISISHERVIDGKWVDSTRKDVPYATVVWAKPDERAQQAAAPGALLEILRDVHDTLASQADSDIDHFETDEDEREAAPSQYAARKVMEVMDMLEAAPSPPGTPEAPADMRASADFIDKRAEQYLQVHASHEPDTGAVSFHYGEAGRDYHSTLVELADDLRQTSKPAVCTAPPAGWQCTRSAGHEGPCAAIQRAAQLDGGQGEGAEE